MSRSFRKTPIMGRTMAKSDKPYKAEEHRRERRAVKVAICVDDELPSPKQFGNACKSPKDGRQWLADPDPRWMRK